MFAAPLKKRICRASGDIASRKSRKCVLVAPADWAHVDRRAVT